MSKLNSKGFTLIELLVVIAIIGILSAIVLASLGSARSRAADAAVKGNLSSTRTQAEIFYGTGNTYASVCGTGTNAIGGMVLAAGKAYSSAITSVNTTLTTAGTGATATCHDSATAWAAEAPLNGSTTASPKMFCVDSTGAAKEKTTVLGASAVAC